MLSGSDSAIIGLQSGSFLKLSDLSRQITPAFLICKIFHENEGKYGEFFFTGIDNEYMGTGDFQTETTWQNTTNTEIQWKL